MGALSHRWGVIGLCLTVTFYSIGVSAVSPTALYRGARSAAGVIDSVNTSRAFEVGLYFDSVQSGYLRAPRSIRESRGIFGELNVRQIDRRRFVHDLEAGRLLLGGHLMAQLNPVVSIQREIVQLEIEERMWTHALRVLRSSELQAKGFAKLQERPGYRFAVRQGAGNLDPEAVLMEAYYRVSSQLFDASMLRHSDPRELGVSMAALYNYEHELTTRLLARSRRAVSELSVHPDAGDWIGEILGDVFLAQVGRGPVMDLERVDFETADIERIAAAVQQPDGISAWLRVADGHSLTLYSEPSSVVVATEFEVGEAFSGVMLPELGKVRFRFRSNKVGENQGFFLRQLTLAALNDLRGPMSTSDQRAWVDRALHQLPESPWVSADGVHILELETGDFATSGALYRILTEYFAMVSRAL
jgi:hypothetical protein